MHSYIKHCGYTSQYWPFILHKQDLNFDIFFFFFWSQEWPTWVAYVCSTQQTGEGTGNTVLYRAGSWKKSSSLMVREYGAESRARLGRGKGSEWQLERMQLCPCHQYNAASRPMLLFTGESPTGRTWTVWLGMEITHSPSCVTDVHQFLITYMSLSTDSQKVWAWFDSIFES